MTRKSSLRIAGYILFFLFFTLVFTVVNFPRENLTGTVNGWLSRASNKALSVAEASPSLPLSVRLSGVSLDTEGNRQVLGDAVVSLDFLAFLAGERSVTVRFSGPLGSSRFRVRSGEDGWGVEVKSLTADLGALPFTEGIPFTIDGMAGVSGNLHTKDPSGKLLDGDGKVTGKGIEIKEGLLEPLGLSPLRFSSLTVFFTVKDSVLTLGENVLEGDLSARVRGTVRLVPSRPERSRLDLTLEITPGPDVKEVLTPLFSLMGARPRVDGSVTVRIRGTVNRPSITA